MSTIGAIVDTAISITSPMREIHQQNPDITRKDLFMSGIRIGRDILGTSSNTLFFAFFGGYMGANYLVQGLVLLHGRNRQFQSV